MTFDHLKDTLGVGGDISNIQGAIERMRVGRLPDCPYCGHKIPKAGVKLCGQCRYEIAWVRGVPCENNPQAIQNLEQTLEQKLQEEWELKRDERERDKRDEYELRFRKKLNELEWPRLIKVYLPLVLSGPFLIGAALYYTSAFQEGTMEFKVGMALVCLFLFGWPLLLAIVGFVMRFCWREKDLTKLIEELESQTGKKTSKRK